MDSLTKTITARLGDRQVQVHYWPIGFDKARDLTPGQRVALDMDGLWGLDVESTALTPAGIWADGFRVRTIQFAPTESEAWVLRMDDPAQRELAQQILDDPGSGRVFTSHTQIDPLAVSQALGVDIAGAIIDTHVLSVMSAPDDTRGQAELKPVAARFGMPQLEQAEKDMKALFDRMYREAHPEIGNRAIKGSDLIAWGFNNVPVDDPLFVTYAGMDALVVKILVPLLQTASRAPAHVLRAERWLSEQAIRLRRRGHLVDREWMDRVEQGALVDEDQAAAVMMDVAGLRTTQNVALNRWFADQGLDLGQTPKTASGAPSLSKDHLPMLFAPGGPLDQLGSDDVRAVAQAYLDHAKVLDRIRRTKEIRGLMDNQGRVHPTLVTVGTVTSRMSASSPNMQAFSKKDPEMRGMFIPEPGYVALSCDFAQIELRVIAAISGETKMINAILAGDDLHQLTADLLGITRQQAKTVNFLTVYGGGAARLMAQLNYTETLDRCKQILRDYWAQYPNIASLNRHLSTETQGIRLISGRWVPIGRYPDGGLRSHATMNYLIQGSSRELLVGAWRRFASTPDRAAMVWFPIHDELVLQVPQDRAEEISAEIGQAMSFDFYGVPVVADADLLIDEHGVSRWMSGDHAKEIRQAKEGK